VGPKDRLRRHPGAIRNGELGGGARNGSPRTATRITSVCTASRSGWLRRWPEYVQKWSPGELGFAGEEARDPEAIIAQGYRGSRYSFDHPAFPNLADKSSCWRYSAPRKSASPFPKKTSSTPSNPPPPSSSTTRRPSTFRCRAEGRASRFHRTGHDVDYVHVTAIPAEPASQAKIQSEPRSLTQISNLRSRNPVRYQPAAGPAPRSRPKEPMDVGPRADRPKTTLRAPADFCVP
jgi:hypothetical protein